MVDRSSYILPSNAPPLHDVVAHDSAVPKGILEERSSNRQIELSDKDNVPTYLKHTGQWYLAEHHHLQHEPALHERYDGSCHADNEDDDAWAEREALHLRQRMQQKSEQYRKYREKQPKQDGITTKSTSGPWEDHVEYAVWKALCKHRRMRKGCEQTNLKSKLRGINELIAESILKWTGVSRTRKQISSHVQVLRNMITNDQYVMQYFPPPTGKAVRKGRAHASRSRKQSQPSSITQTTTSTSQPARALLPPADLLGDAFAKPQLIPHKFAMFVCENSTRLHTFTEVDAQNQFPDMSMTEFEHVSDGFAEWGNLSDFDTTSLQIILVKASIRLMVGHRPGAELGIEFDLWGTKDLTSHNGAPCNTYFYESGNLAERGQVAGKIDCENGWMRVPFGSGFWAQKVTYLGSLLRDAAQRRCLKGGEDSKTVAMARETALRYEERVRREVSKLTAVQEFFMKTPGSGQLRRTTLVFWTFSQPTSGDNSKTKWYNVINRRPVTRSEHGNHSFSAMSAITMGVHPTEAIFQSMKSGPFPGISLPEEMLPALASAGLPVEMPEAGEAAYTHQSADFDGGQIGMLPDPASGLSIEQYQGSQAIQDTRLPPYDPRDAYTIVGAEYDQETSNLYEERNQAVGFVDDTSYDCRLDDMDVDSSQMELQGTTHFEGQAGENNALDALYAPAPRHWLAHSFLDPNIYQTRHFIDEAAYPQQLETQAAEESNGMVSDTRDFAFDDSAMSQQPLRCVLDSLQVV